VKNSIQEGDTIALAAPYAVASGGGALIGAIFGVAVTALANAEVGSFELEGVFTLPKATGVAATLGAKCYWDNTNKNVTATVGSNTLIGVFVAAYASGDTLANVRLNGSF
jgi:predicted RecA/RadA family phage recombinase